MSHSVGATYFEKLYAATSDPWDYQTSVYEQEKYAATCEALQSRVFERGFEIGCSFGSCRACWRCIAAACSQSIWSKPCWTVPTAKMPRLIICVSNAWKSRPPGPKALST